MGFSLWWLLLFQSTGSRVCGLSSCVSWALKHRLNVPSMAHGPVAPQYVESSWTRDQTHTGGFFTTEHRGKLYHFIFKCHAYACAQSCPTLCDSMNYSPPGSSVHGILQARILEWTAISFSRGPSQPRNQTYVSCVSCIARQILYH